jgi:glycosyltransferase involved in cell wall biosynthesis
VTYGPAGISRRIPKGVRHALYFLACLAGAVRSDLVLAQDTVSAGLPALLAARILRRPFVVRVPGDYAWEQGLQRFGVTDSVDHFQSRRYGWRTEILRTIQCRVVASADAVITPSEYFKGIIAGWIGRADTIRVVHGCIRYPRTPPAPSAPAGDPIILTAGRLVPWKGVATLVTLVAEHPEWKLVVVGDGPQAATLRVLAHRLNAPVVFTGPVSRDVLSTHLCRATVFALNTAFESFSHQVLEAMHAGVPVVATRVGSLPELIEDGKNGILVRPDDRDQIASAIRRLVVDDELRATIVRNAKVTAARYSAERMVDGVVEVCRMAEARRSADTRGGNSNGPRPTVP